MKVFVTGTRGIPHVMGGVEVHCEALMPRLARMGFDITVVRRSGYVKDSAAMGEWEGVKLLDVPSPRRKSLEAILHTVRAVWAAKRASADVVHIHAIGPALAVPLARLLGLKVVYRRLSRTGGILGITAPESVGVPVLEGGKPVWFFLDGKTILLEERLLSPWLKYSCGRLVYVMMSSRVQAMLFSLFITF